MSGDDYIKPFYKDKVFWLILIVICSLVISSYYFGYMDGCRVTKENIIDALSSAIISKNKVVL